MSESTMVENTLAPMVAVPAEVSAPVFVKDEEAVAALKSSGDLVVRTGFFKDLEALGIYVHGMGVWKLQRGRSVVKQATADMIMREIAGAIRAVVEKKAKGWEQRLGQLTHHFTELFNADTGLQKLMAETERAMVPKAERQGEALPTVKSFEPGERVGDRVMVLATKDVHLHTGS